MIREEVTEKMSVKHEDIEKYYNEHKTEFVREERIFLQEILLSTEGKDAAGVAAAEKKAKDLVARARKGERFAEMARDNSDSVSAKGMGELPPYKKDVLSKNLEDLVWNQPKGYITDPVRTPNGFLILRVEDHQKAGQAELAEVENQINEKLLAPRLDAAVRDYLTKLRKDAFLEIKADYIDTGAAGGKDTAWVDPAQLRPETVKKEEVESNVRHKRLLWSIPVPGTQTSSHQFVGAIRVRSAVSMKSPYLSDLKPNQVFTTTFLVHGKDVRQKKSGEPYLSLLLGDRTGEVDAKMWDNVVEVVDTFDRDDFVKVKGLLQIFQNRLQMTVHKMARVLDADVDFADFFPASTRDPLEMFAELRGFGGSHAQSPLAGSSRMHSWTTNPWRACIAPRRPPSMSIMLSWAD